MISFTITNKQRPKATVLMLVNFGNRQYIKSIGVGCPAAMWNEKKHRARVTDTFDGTLVNDRIDRYERLGYQAMRHFEDINTQPTKEQFAEYLDELIVPRHKEHYFCEYIETTYIPRYSENRGRHTITGFRSMLGKIQQYEKERHRRLSFSDIDMNFYNDFQAWFYGKGYSDNYFGTLIKFVKQCYTEARVVDSLHEKNAIEHRDFVTVKRTADAVYLTEDEIQNVYDCDLSIAALMADDATLNEFQATEKAASYAVSRNMFLIGCYTGLRVSDFKRLTNAHFGEKFITIKTRKTRADVVIPIHPKIRDIMASGFDLGQCISEQKINAHIKDICRLAGITQEVIHNRNIGGKNIEELIPKYKLISNHTARRSFATNAIKAGVSPLAVMKILGHTRQTTTLKYIKLTAQENAEQLLNHPFFMQ